ncbi:hypothetical protein AVEN_139175-1 [Araneus ventricosus]|uniref:Uncharacterized protein n=1 Tax=Araneus ventricosus TaxID=182803 RepID=A0A4Y2TBP7_ARAVE|nr:hypothetical protein AVEN_139175-1 [Araneus ventricosus]
MKPKPHTKGLLQACRWPEALMEKNGDTGRKIYNILPRFVSSLTLGSGMLSSSLNMVAFPAYLKRFYLSRQQSLQLWVGWALHYATGMFHQCLAYEASAKLRTEWLKERVLNNPGL